MSCSPSRMIVGIACVYALTTSACVQHICEKYPNNPGCPNNAETHTNDMASSPLTISVSPKRLSKAGGRITVTIDSQILTEPVGFSLAQDVSKIDLPMAVKNGNSYNIDVPSSVLTSLKTGITTVQLNTPDQSGQAAIYLFTPPTWATPVTVSTGSDNTVWAGVGIGHKVLTYNRNGTGMNMFKMFSWQANSVTEFTPLPSGIDGVSFGNETLPTISLANLFISVFKGTGLAYGRCPNETMNVCKLPGLEIPLISMDQTSVDPKDQFIASIGQDNTTSGIVLAHALDVQNNVYTSVGLVNSPLYVARFVTLIDLNYDNKPDLLIIDNDRNSYVYLYTKTPSFDYDADLSADISATLGTSIITAVSAGDYDGDSFVDLAVARGSVVSIYSNQSDSKIQLSGNGFTANNSIVNINSGDVNSDGISDLVFVSGTTTPRSIGVSINQR